MKELSKYLKAERLNRNVPLEVISERDGISLGMLKALEDGDLERFDAVILVREAIRSYCKVLEIDPEYVLQTYASEIDACDIQRAGIIRFGRQMKILHKRRRMISFPLFLLTLATIGIFYGGTWVSEKRARLYAPPPAGLISTQEDYPAELHQKLAPSAQPNTEKQDQRSQAESKTEEPPKTAEAKPVREADPVPKDSEKIARRAENSILDAERAITEAKRSASAAATEPQVPAPAPAVAAPQVALSNSMEVLAEDKPAPTTEERKGLKFVVEADDKTWIQVKIDDKVTRSAMLGAGDKREWSAEKGIQVVVGNAGGIRMKLNDQPINAPRDSGKVLRFRLPEYIREAG